VAAIAIGDFSGKGSVAHRVFVAAESYVIAPRRDDRTTSDRTTSGIVVRRSETAPAGSTERYAQQSPAPQGETPALSSARIAYNPPRFPCGDDAALLQWIPA
jgi:hypothetical protein